MPIEIFEDGNPWSPNHILSSLTAEDVASLQNDMQRVTLVLEQVLHAPHQPMDHVFFLEKGIISLTADTKDAGSVEVGLIGREGMAGISAALSADFTAMHRALVQVPGTAIRMRTSAFREASVRLPHFQTSCLRYAQYLMVQASQTAACNARHDLVERLARWLLMSWDRISGDDLPMRQEFLALMLGVRRSGVSVVTNALQSTGAVRQSRGHITLLDRAGLESEACSCYRFLRECQASIFDSKRDTERLEHVQKESD